MTVLQFLSKIPVVFIVSGVIWAYAAQHYEFYWPWALLATIFSVVVAKWKWLSIFVKTFPRDLRFVAFFIAYGKKRAAMQEKNQIISDVFQTEVVQKTPNKVALKFENTTWTFKQVDEFSNRIANYFLEKGYKKGEVVSILMESSPEMVCLWLGLSKLGVISALININLRQESLVHCVQASKSKSVIFGGSLSQALIGTEDKLKDRIDFFCYGNFPDVSLSKLAVIDLELMVKGCSISSPDVKNRPQPKDDLMYIFTSGTTGLPKACRISHSRYFTGAALPMLFGITSNDTIYSALPMYHSAASILGISAVLVLGASVAIRKKFSASKFWEDCIRYDCTAVQYIGEVGRYLLAQPVKETDQQHKVRLAYGNGMRGEIWKQFQERFKVDRIGEFYAATEGNFGLMTHPGSPVGSCGFITVSLPFPKPVIIKVDEDTYEPVRNENGFCIPVKPGEIGEIIGKISPVTPLPGYTDNKQTEKKILHNVFEKGDKFFLSGDMITKDNLGNCYFQDRIGDTFRWKGENVSTTEVETIISKLLHLQDVIVYGVNIPGTEGRAGMATITDPNGKFSLGVLEKKMEEFLPKYARPLFLRVTKEVEITGSFKLKKVKLRKEGFDPTVIPDTDKLYYLETSSKTYKPLSKERFSEINCGAIKY